jgi:fructose/tagatose bisphosphate aldolase
VSVARPDQYAAMLDDAAAGGFAYPAVNVTSSQTLNAALDGFAAAGSDGIVQGPSEEPATCGAAGAPTRPPARGRSR